MSMRLSAFIFLHRITPSIKITQIHNSIGTLTMAIIDASSPPSFAIRNEMRLRIKKTPQNLKVTAFLQINNMLL